MLNCHAEIVPGLTFQLNHNAGDRRNKSMKRRSGIVVALMVLGVFRLNAGSENGHPYGPRFKGTAQAQILARQEPVNDGNSIRYWNRIACDASGLDHTPVLPGENRVFGEQFGPCRAARAMAIVQIAVFDAVNAILGGYQEYTSMGAVRGNTSVDAAVAQAAHDTLVALFPSQQLELDRLLGEALAPIRPQMAKARGVEAGSYAAAKILALKSNDGSQHTEPRVGIEFITSDLPGFWRQDPISLIPLALGAYWGDCIPFVMKSGSQFRLPPPPALTSPEYTAAFDEVKRLGGDGTNTVTERTEDQTLMGIYWAYDGTPALCAPPRLYNQMTCHIAEQMGTDGIALARLLALANTAMADAAIAAWESKFYYQFWRPVTGIREADPGTGPTGTGDGNDATIGDVTFSPLGAPASNLQGPNFTPPFPAYPSGHATIGGSLFQTLRRFYGTDNIAFTFVSDELNGVTQDNNGDVRPLAPRSFTSLSHAEGENAQSRIYLGIHWAFDVTGGISQGRAIADYIFERAFLPGR
jgi:hypothetical protein